VLAVVGGVFLLYVRDIRSLAFLVLAVFTLAYATRAVSQLKGRDTLDLFGIPSLMARLEDDPEISKSDRLCVQRALGAAVDAYLRSLTPDARRLDTVHAADYETHRERTMEAVEAFPAYVQLKCQSIFQDLDRVLVRNKLIQTAHTPLTHAQESALTFAWVN
jgi:hypothetical protein